MIEATEEFKKELYDNYGKTSDKLIKEYLDKIILVKKSDGEYYQYENEFIEKIKNRPRHESFFSGTTNKKFTGLDEWKSVVYLCKSSSRFFLKADIGEIFDQIDKSDLSQVRGIAYCDDYQTLDGSDGEHHLMIAYLLYNSREKKLERILKK